MAMHTQEFEALKAELFADRLLTEKGPDWYNEATYVDVEAIVAETFPSLDTNQLMDFAGAVYAEM